MISTIIWTLLPASEREFGSYRGDQMESFGEQIGKLRALGTEQLVVVGRSEEGNFLDFAGNFGENGPSIGR